MDRSATFPRICAKDNMIHPVHKMCLHFLEAMARLPQQELPALPLGHLQRNPHPWVLMGSGCYCGLRQPLLGMLFRVTLASRLFDLRTLEIRQKMQKITMKNGRTVHVQCCVPPWPKSNKGSKFGYPFWRGYTGTGEARGLLATQTVG